MAGPGLPEPRATQRTATPRAPANELLTAERG